MLRILAMLQFPLSCRAAMLPCSASLSVYLSATRAIFSPDQHEQVQSNDTGVSFTEYQYNNLTTAGLTTNSVVIFKVCTL